MPTSKMPTTVNCLSRGSTAAGVTSPCGAISVTLSPTNDVERARQFGAEHDAELARSAGRRGCRSSCAALEVGHLLLGLGQDAAHHDAAHLLVEGQHALRLDVGRGGAHTSDCARPAARSCGQSASSPPVPGNLDVRGDAENARAQFLLEAVHHRQHDDQRRHAEREPERCEISEMKEMNGLRPPVRFFARV